MLNIIKYYFNYFIEYIAELSYYNDFIAARKGPYFKSNRYDYPSPE